jgi:hypothetical protein
MTLIRWSPNEWPFWDFIRLHVSSLPYLLYIPHILVSIIYSTWWCLVKNTNFKLFVQLLPSYSLLYSVLQAQIFFSSSCFQTPPTSVLPLGRQIKFNTSLIQGIRNCNQHDTLQLNVDNSDQHCYDGEHILGLRHVAAANWVATIGYQDMCVRLYVVQL